MPTHGHGPRPTTMREWFTFFGVFFVMFLALALIRGCWLTAARGIQEQQAETRMTAILERRKAKKELADALEKHGKKLEQVGGPTKQLAAAASSSKPSKLAAKESKKAKKAD